jgi:hypothetical protein
MYVESVVQLCLFSPKKKQNETEFLSDRTSLLYSSRPSVCRSVYPTPRPWSSNSQIDFPVVTSDVQVPLHEVDR